MPIQDPEQKVYKADCFSTTVEGYRVEHRIQ